AGLLPAPQDPTETSIGRPPDSLAATIEALRITLAPYLPQHVLARLSIEAGELLFVIGVQPRPPYAVPFPELTCPALGPVEIIHLALNPIASQLGKLAVLKIGG
ncbi:MAG TPA: hypothetical protein PKD34_01320, partial [Candidatus Doudnabacteria bacterium]|nr:hypothetical protein [Candidatus Doudnabacteria bacterium]